MKKSYKERFAFFIKHGTIVAVAAAVIAVAARGSALSREVVVSENLPSESVVTMSADKMSAVSSQTISNVAPNAVININTAAAEELQTLPGIGEAKSAAIVEYREKHGAFADISEITNVSGIGEAIFGQIRGKITVGAETSVQPNSSVEEPPTAPSTAAININTATAEELQTLPGIGEAKSAAIVEYREKHGAFADISEITNVSGIGNAIFGQIRDKISV